MNPSLQILSGSGLRSRATGGTITYAGGYVVHTFTSNGTFTSLEDLTIDCLIVAGGGGGGQEEAATGERE